jgi:hypothetical protein
LLAASAWFVAASGLGFQDETISFSKARIIIEFNASAEDVGVQVLVDGEPWKRLDVFHPNGNRILEIDGRGSLRLQGLTELFFESSEPSLKDVPLNEFLARFPEGTYELKGATIDGIGIEGAAVLDHTIPAGPEVVFPASDDGEPSFVDPDHFVIEWRPVTQTIDGSTSLRIVGYQVIVEQENPLRVFSIDLPASATSVRVPAGFLVQRDTLHKFEVLAVEESGNQTITEGEFLTYP